MKNRSAEGVAYLTALAYVLVVIVSAAYTDGALVLEDLLFWTAVAAWSATTRIQFPLGFSLSQLFVVALAAAFATTPLTASLAVFLGYYNPKILRVLRNEGGGYSLTFDLFNRSQHAAATLAAALVFRAVGPTSPSLFGDGIAVVAAGAAYIITNAFLVALIASQYYGASFPQNLGGNLHFGLPYFLFTPVSLVLARIYTLPEPLLGPSNALAVIALLVPIYYAKWRWDEVVRLKEAFDQFARSLANAIDAKDPYTRSHSERVAAIAHDIAVEMGLPSRALEELQTGALLHDIGKIAIPDQILLKPGKLTPEERRVIETHPMEGSAIVEEVRLLEPALPVIRYHHERWDGGGYPYGLKGEEIPLLARIAAVADTYEAMTSDRPYRKAIPVDEALEEIRRQRGFQFDPEVVDAFLRVVRRNPDWLDRNTWLARHAAERIRKGAPEA